MDELLAFVRSRLDEEEASATAATPGPWSYDPSKEWYDGEDFVTMTNGQEFVGYGGPSFFAGAVCITGDAGHSQSMADAEHIARHDPARTLRDVRARRATLARCEEEMSSGVPPLVGFARGTAWEMAQRWSDHKGFKQAWKP
ncbi:hypothetical protein FAF44_22450 [Nonomuraea sp. MG754425]|uniref:DUF6221 family protein n=1 Tax=Nonomuraea sp. MG754425 TaxID=2570319 RepID=UPI001F2A3F16|nr:DUF6221 family protein [Nonomuraea sp. MG754425]MCF6471138.1 hypothetical protein [Nonomuraea sp. MG754425]